MCESEVPSNETVTMTMRKRHRKKIGDVIAVECKGGYGYAQYVADDPRKNFGPLIRVFRKVTPEMLKDIDHILADDIRFYVYFDVTGSINRGEVLSVGNGPLPDGFVFPPLKVPYERWEYHKKDSPRRWTNYRNWCVVLNGQRTTVGTLTKEQESWSCEGLINTPLLRRRIEINYRPEDEAWNEREFSEDVDDPCK
jgi:hypothetical protein